MAPYKTVTLKDAATGVLKKILNRQGVGLGFDFISKVERYSGAGFGYFLNQIGVFAYGKKAKE